MSATKLSRADLDSIEVAASSSESAIADGVRAPDTVETPHEADEDDEDWDADSEPEAEAAMAAAKADPLLLTFDDGGRSSLSQFSKADFDRALCAYLPALLAQSQSSSDPRLRNKMLALRAASPDYTLPFEFSLLFTAAEQRLFCDQRAIVCLDCYLERFALVFRAMPAAVYLGECALCCREDAFIRERPCCRLPVCAVCLDTCVRLALSAGRPQVACPCCPAAIRRDELSLLYLRADPALMRRHEQLLVEYGRDPNVKTCPGCSHVCRHVASDPPDVVCEACGELWCFACHGPRHPGQPCPDASDPDLRLLMAWSRQKRPEDWAEGTGATPAETRTARTCPECRALIERNGGCPHVNCTVCGTDFCFLCGKKYQQKGRYLGLVPKRFLGGHDSQLSVHGCSAILLHDHPHARRALRRGALALTVCGVAVAGLVAAPLLLLASPVWAPLLAIRERRRRRLRRDSMAGQKGEEDA